MQIVRKGHFVSFRRSESEKRAWNLTKELDKQKEEIESLRAELNALKEDNTEDEGKKKTTRKSSK